MPGVNPPSSLARPVSGRLDRKLAARSRRRSDKLTDVTFEWDARKAAANLKKHGVAFEDAATVFLDPLATTFPDPDHSLDEHREITIGRTMKGHLVFVSHCEREARIRIISARATTRTECDQYEKGIGS